MHLRMDRGLTLVDLAKMLGSTQRNISHYETVAECALSDLLVKLATISKVSADDLLGLKPPKQPPRGKEDPETTRLWKNFSSCSLYPRRTGEP
jgi:predicted transcriptional regulator